MELAKFRKEFNEESGKILERVRREHSQMADSMRHLPKDVLKKACLEAGITLQQDPGSISVEDAKTYYQKIQQYEGKIVPKPLPNELSKFKELCAKKMEQKMVAHSK